jgi:hypothetical protein
MSFGPWNFAASECSGWRPGKWRKKGNSHSSQISWHMNHMKLKSENKTKLMDLVTTIIWFHEGYSWPVPPPEIEKWAVKDCQAVAVPSTQLSWHCRWKTRISAVSGHSCGKSTIWVMFIHFYPFFTYGYGSKLGTPIIGWWIPWILN